MTSTANFLVATRLARVLGETYRSSEAALKELVDNAWDADASCVWISLPAPLSADAVIVRDNGSGMTSQEMRGEYLNVASDKRTRSGERTKRFKRRIKGRKGIGKFAGLMIASRMEIRSMARGRICTLIVDKKSLLENQGDIESVPLPFSDEPAAESTSGTTVILTDLDSRLNFPNPDKLREALIYEYGHDQQFTIFVNEVPLSVDDIPGSTVTEITDVPDAGETRLQFTVAEGKRLPRAPGIVIKVDGKTVGRPSLFGLESDDEIPPSILRRVYGEVELSGVEDFVTADWSAIIENSKSFQNVENFVRGIVKKSISETYSREINLQKARLKQQIHRRLSALPEFRRQYAEDALLRILQKFYGESEERMAAIAMVALDAMEQDVL